MVGGSAEGVKSTLPSVRPEERTTLVEPESESGLCQEDLLLLAAVYSAPANSLARDTIRRTWGGQLRSLPGVRLVFILGTHHDTAVHVNRASLDAIASLIAYHSVCATQCIFNSLKCKYYTF